MRRNCNLELRLVTPPHVFPGANSSMLGPEDQKQQQQQLTIFYDGKVAVCDATELQARALIMLAGREVDEKMNRLVGSDRYSPLLISPLYSPVSMKRSLKSFLEKRRTRAQATSPYGTVARNSNVD